MTKHKQVFNVHAYSPSGAFEEVDDIYASRKAALAGGVQVYADYYGEHDGCIKDVECELDENGTYDDGNMVIEITWSWVRG